VTCASAPASRGHEGSVGKPAPFIEVRIVDENDNECGGSGRRGCLPGPTVMQEYYKDRRLRPTPCAMAGSLHRPVQI